MTYNINWNSIGLHGDLFTIAPPSEPTAVVWAGMSALKNEFNSVLQASKGFAPTQVILCRGPVGGGKTHASLYFDLKEHWPEQSPGVREVKVIRVQTPTETGKPARDFYIDVMEDIGLDNTQRAVREAVEEIGHNAAQKALRRTMVSADLTNALLRLGEEENNPLLNAYFLGKCTTTELRKLGLNRNIEKTQDHFRALAGVIQCHIGLSESHDVTKHNRFCLWIDEMENFIYFTPPQYRPFGQGLRELVDRLPFFFTLFMNFTLTSPEEYEEIELILGAYLIDRVTQQIFFDEMKDEEMLQYVSDLLSHYRTQGLPVDSKKTPYYPFTEDALTLLLSNLQRRTPRDVNKRCRNALIKAFEEGALAEGKVTPIGRDFVQKMSREELDKEIG